MTVYRPRHNCCARALTFGVCRAVRQTSGKKGGRHPTNRPAFFLSKRTVAQPDAMKRPDLGCSDGPFSDVYVAAMATLPTTPNRHLSAKRP
jgi:hypothetical protein